MTAASDAAAVAAMLPIDHPLAQLARMRLDTAVREELALMKIYAPDPSTNRKSHLGTIERRQGDRVIRVPVELDFHDGVAEVERDLLTEGGLDYLRRTGYGIDAPAPPRAREEPGHIEHFQSTAMLHDAAVEPDAAGPINTIVRDSDAADPHGPGVRAIEVGSREWGELVDKHRRPRPGPGPDAELLSDGESAEAADDDA